MKNVLKLLLISIAIALVANGISFVGHLNIVWIVALALFVADMQFESIFIAIAAGSFFDIMLGDNVGITGFSVLVALIIYVILNSMGFVATNWQKAISVFFVYALSYVVEFIVKIILGEMAGFDGEVLMFILKSSIWGGIITIILLLIFQNWNTKNKNVVKL